MALEWGAGDDVAVFCALVTTITGAWLQPKNRTFKGLGKLATNGLALGPLILITFSPLDALFKKAGLDINLLEIAVNESKLAIWLAAVISIYQLLEEIA